MNNENKKILISDWDKHFEILKDNQSISDKDIYDDYSKDDLIKLNYEYKQKVKELNKILENQLVSINLIRDKIKLINNENGLIERKLDLV